MKTMSEKDAKANGYRPLTTSYQLPKEQWMLDNVLADMKRGNIDTVLVPDAVGVEVWRRAPMAH
ncbi:MAG: hypothetical protein ACEQSB_06685 [Undibacterium sp.]